MSAENSKVDETTIVQYEGYRTTLVKNGNGWINEETELGEYPVDFQTGKGAAVGLVEDVENVEDVELEELTEMFRSAHGLE